MALGTMGFKRVVVDGGVEILYNSEYVGDALTLDTGAFTDGICKAGTPIAVDGTKAAVTGGTKGTWTLTISTAFANDETLIINGETFTCAAAEDVAAKKFAGANATAQAASLVKMCGNDKFTVAAASGVITFTQKNADSAGAAPTASTEATTGVIGDVTKGTSAVDGTNNVYGILLHDVYADRPQGTVVIGGYIAKARAEEHMGDTYAQSVIDALKNVVFIDKDAE